MQHEDSQNLLALAFPSIHHHSLTKTLIHPQTRPAQALEDAAETGRIGKYYAVEDMLTTDPSEKFGTVTLQQHYNKIAVDGQEYDPYTTMFAGPPKD